MGPEAWLLYGALAVLGVGWTTHLYRRREVAVPGRGLLAGARAAILAILVLLLFDPTLPGGVTGADRIWVLLDGSLSMSVAPPGEASPWEQGLERAGERQAAGARVALFGEGVIPLEEGWTEERLSLPGFTGSRLTPALEWAAETGATRVEVISDLRVADGLAARATVRRLGLDVVVGPSLAAVRNGGIESFRLPTSVDAGEALSAEVSFFAGAGASGDSATVQVLEEARPVASTGVALPEEGRLGRVELELPPPSASDGQVRYVAHILVEDDAFGSDDRRVAYTTVDPETGTLVLVSMSPDWEPRFLLPVLERATGLPTRGFLGLQGNRFLVTSAGSARNTADEATVADAALGAELLVVHGFIATEAPTWLVRALQRSRRSIVFPMRARGAAAAGIETGPPASGEWYLVDGLPSSPLAGELAGASLQGLPPLADVLPRTGEAGGGTAPLQVRLRARGAPEAPLTLVRTEEGGRRVVVLARGFWRWAFRNSGGRDVYDRLWAGVAGWLLADEPLVRGPGVRPLSPVSPPEVEIGWTASGLGGERIALRLERGDSVAFDTTLVVPESGRFGTPALPPGTYGWVADEDEGGEGGEVGSTRGRLDVESYTDELLNPPQDGLEDGTVGVDSAVRTQGAGRPLRTHPLPYLLLLALLSAEWVGRRRRGLR